MADAATPGRFRGYAAVFDVPDRGRDVIRSGAFAQTLKGRSRFDIPLLWQHDAGEPIGLIRSIGEDARGLMIDAQLSLDSHRGREAWALIRDGAVSGLSIGYRPSDASPIPKQNLRELRKVELVEVSVVSMPMQPLARVTAIL